ncbi:hypothetical protein BSL82_05675 [Tardibacter chloracetimidivorans]|uniref:Phage tail protein n=1 Tax=Tardibacter chloracetimidivorans TaxID=1921510 RepID=A0A1L3ZT95_9SPHN|nr:phage tail tube protein [Tardibacter chloracetimidivorans]API58862.1 hypothetical protein BSL82_05675 [Tardibacter chloracetimidivorans]
MALLSKGTLLKLGDGSTPTEVFTAIPGVQNITVPAVVLDDHEVTDLDSTAKEYIAGLGDAGEFSFQLVLKKAAAGNGYHAQQAALESYVGDGELHNFQVVLPAPFSTTYEFAAFVKSFTPSSATNAAITATVTLRVSGDVTKTVA